MKSLIFGDFCNEMEEIIVDKFKEIRPIVLVIYHIIDDNCETYAYWIDIDEFKNNNKYS